MKTKVSITNILHFKFRSIDLYTLCHSASPLPIHLYVLIAFGMRLAPYHTYALWRPRSHQVTSSISMDSEETVISDIDALHDSGSGFYCTYKDKSVGKKIQEKT